MRLAAIPGRQAPGNAGASAPAIAMSPLGDTLPRPGHDERALQQPRTSWVLLGRRQRGSGSGVGGPRITMGSQNDPNT